MGHVVGMPRSKALAGGVSLTNLVLWLRADMGVYKDAGSTLASNSDTVQRWTDQSGNGYHANQATSGSRPTYLTNQVNSLPGISFNSKHLLVTNNSDLNLNTDSSCFVVISHQSIPTNVNSILSKDNNASAGAYLFYLSDIIVGKTNVDRPFVAAGTQSGTANTNPGIMAAVISGTTVSYYRNGAADGVQSLVTGTTTTKDLMIGAFGNGSQNVLVAQLHEIILYKAAVSSGVRAAVTAELGSRWGITV